MSEPLRLALFLASAIAAGAFAPGLIAAPAAHRPMGMSVVGPGRIRMQVSAPVKPDIQLAPTEPKNDAMSKKGKKHKLLLFNDNMNKCGAPPGRAPPAPIPPVAAAAASYRTPRGRSAPRRREYVAKILKSSIPDYTDADAYVVMQKAHKDGMAVVGIWVFELAEARAVQCPRPRLTARAATDAARRRDTAQAYCDLLKEGGLISAVTEDE